MTGHDFPCCLQACWAIFAASFSFLRCMIFQNYLQPLNQIDTWQSALPVANHAEIYLSPSDGPVVEAEI